MSYIPTEYNNYYKYLKLKDFITPYVLIDSCENFSLSDAVKLSVQLLEQKQKTF